MVGATEALKFGRSRKEWAGSVKLGRVRATAANIYLRTMFCLLFNNCRALIKITLQYLDVSCYFF